MRNRTGVFWTGIIVIAVPFLGVPGTWKTIILEIIGLWLCLIAFSPNGKKTRGGRSGGHKKENQNGAVYSESQPPKVSSISSDVPVSQSPIINHEESPRV